MGKILVSILENLQSDLTPELKIMYNELIKNQLSLTLVNKNSQLMKKIFSKSPKIILNNNGTLFSVNMQPTPSIKIGSYAPLDNTKFEITPYC